MVDSKILPHEIFQKRDQLGLNNSIQMLTEIIDTCKDDKIRKDAINYIGRISGTSNDIKKVCFETLENVLISDENLDIKCQAAKTLGKIRYEKALKPLKWILEQESTNTEVKIVSLKAIVNTRFEEPEIKLFIKELYTDYKSIKDCVRHHLISLNPEILIGQLLEALKDEKFCERHKKEIINLIGFELSSVNISFEDSSYLNIKYPEIILKLKKNKINLLEHIVPNLRDDNKELMENSLTILKLLGNEINQDLINFLRNDDFIIKENAIKLIGKLKIKEAINALLENLDDMYEEVNKATIETLGEIGDLSAVLELLKVLDIEDINYEYIDLDMKWICIDAIKNIYLQNKNASFNYLYSTLITNNDILKESVAYILGEIGYNEFVNPLVKLLNEKNLDTRKNASIALGKIGNKEAIDPLIKIVEDDYNYWLLKKVAVDAVYNVYVKNLFVESEKILDPSKSTKRFFVKQTERLIDHLNNNLDENFKVKLSIIKILELFGGKTALNALLKQVNDFYRLIRISASKAIKKIEKRVELENESS